MICTQIISSLDSPEAEILSKRQPQRAVLRQRVNESDIMMVLRGMSIEGPRGEQHVGVTHGRSRNGLTVRKITETDRRVGQPATLFLRIHANYLVCQMIALLIKTEST